MSEQSNEPDLSLVRGSGKDQVISVINVTGSKIDFPTSVLKFINASGIWTDLLTGKVYINNRKTYTEDVEPYQVLWLKRSL